MRHCTRCCTLCNVAYLVDLSDGALSAGPTSIPPRAPDTEGAARAAPRGARSVQEGATPGPGSGGHHLRRLGAQLIGNSVASATQDNYGSGFRSWGSFYRLTKRDEFFGADVPHEEVIWALIEFAAWCFDAGNLMGTVVEKFAAIQYVHRTEWG